MLPIAINFEKSFVLFHKLLFSNDYWVLILKRSNYINVTRRVLMHAACAILLFILGGSILCYSLYRYFVKKKRMSQKNSLLKENFFFVK